MENINLKKAELDFVRTPRIRKFLNSIKLKHSELFNRQFKKNFKRMSVKRNTELKVLPRGFRGKSHDKKFFFSVFI